MKLSIEFWEKVDSEFRNIINENSLCSASEDFDNAFADDDGFVEILTLANLFLMQHIDKGWSVGAFTLFESKKKRTFFDQRNIRLWFLDYVIEQIKKG